MSPKRKFRKCKAYKKEPKMNKSRIREINAKELPTSMKAGRDINIGDINAKKLPTSMKAGRDINIGDINAKELPISMKAGRDINIGDINAKELPTSMKAGRDINIGDINANDEGYKPKINESKLRSRLLWALRIALSIGSTVAVKLFLQHWGCG